MRTIGEQCEFRAGMDLKRIPWTNREYLVTDKRGGLAGSFIVGRDQVASWVCSAWFDDRITVHAVSPIVGGREQSNFELS